MQPAGGNPAVREFLRGAVAITGEIHDSLLGSETQSTRHSAVGVYVTYHVTYAAAALDVNSKHDEHVEICRVLTKYFVVY